MSARCALSRTGGPAGCSADGQLETEDGGDPGGELDGQRSNLAPLDPTDRRVRDTDHPTDLSLAQSGGEAADQEVRPDPDDQESATSLTSVPGMVMGWHREMVRIRRSPATYRASVAAVERCTVPTMA